MGARTERKGGKMRGRLKVGIVALLVVTSLASIVLFAGPLLGWGEDQTQDGDILSMGFEEIRDPAFAAQHGLRGYLEISYPPDSPSVLSVHRGGEASIDVLIHLVSYVPALTEMQVCILPEASVFCDYRAEERAYKLISYNPSGNLTIKAGETVSVTMTVCVPEDFPESVTAVWVDGGRGIGIDGDWTNMAEIGAVPLRVTIDG
jgi:hypothetical protein